MRHSCHQTLWRASFIDALQLVGAAAARLPVGAPDPVLCAESAVELYTGGLWATDDLDFYVAQPHLLIAELFAVGFRWTRSPRVGRGLWHPELRMGVKITDDRAPLGPAEVANLLTIAADGEGVGRVRASLKVLGIEDVIAEQVASWRTHRVPSALTTTRIHMLIALARRGIGGPFRAGYLQRRLAHETGGEVAFEATWSGHETEHDTAPRTMALSTMGAVANTWCVTSGFTFDWASARAPRHPRERSGKRIRHSDDKTGREGGSGSFAARIIPFDGMQPLPPREQYPESDG
jgi:hypothetical protein